MTKTEAFQNSTLFMGLTTKNGYKVHKLYSIKASDGDGDFHWDRASTAYRMNQEGVLEEMVTDVPRVDYTNTCPELLIEGQSTNLALRSNEFDNAGVWMADTTGTGSLTITANYGIAPDGTMTADRLQYVKGTGYANLPQFFTAINGQTYTFSIWVKSLSGTPTLSAFYDGASGYNITVSTEWVRYTKTIVANGTDIRFILALSITNPATSATADVLFWGAQLEALPYASSYIPTTSASVTRVRDIATNITTDFTGLTGTIFVRARVEDSVFTKDDTILSLWGDDTDNYILIYSDKDRNLKVSTYGNPDQNDYSYALASDGIYNIAVGYDFSGVNNKLNIAINGVLKRANATQTNNAPTILNTFELGNLIGTLPQIDNRVIGVMWFDSQLSDSDIVNITA